MIKRVFLASAPLQKCEKKCGNKEKNVAIKNFNFKWLTYLSAMTIIEKSSSTEAAENLRVNFFWSNRKTSPRVKSS